MFRLRRPKEFRLTWRQCGFLILYTLAMVVVLIVLHEGSHILAAMALGVRFSELELGFMGINPSVTLPDWFTGVRQTVVHYVGGLAVGTVFLLFYLGHWMRKYRRRPSFLTWSLGAVTLMLAAMQFAMGYLEGRYHAAYIIGAMVSFSPTDILTYGWALAAVFFHSALCPWKMSRGASLASKKGPTGGNEKGGHHYQRGRGQVMVCSFLPRLALKR